MERHGIVQGVCILLALGTLAGCADKDEAWDEAKEAAVRTEVLALATKHNAATNWWVKTDLPTDVYTLRLQEALLTGTKRPVVFIGPVDDIAKNNGDYILYVGDTDWSNIGWPSIIIRYRLTASEELANRILTDSRLRTFGGFPHWAVVAVISDVKKVSLSALPQALHSEAADVCVGSGSTIIAEGECIDLLPVPWEFTTNLLTPEAYGDE